MVRVRIELLPAGGGEPQILQEMLIVNDGTGDKTNGNYRACLSHASGYRAGAGSFADPGRPAPAEIWKRAAVTGWRRDRSAAELVHVILDRMFRRSP